MKNVYLAIVCLLSVALPFRGNAQNKTTYLIEAESFQFRGGWVVESVPGAKVSGNKIARVFSGKSVVPDALTVIDIKNTDSYTVWVNSPDFPNDHPGTRLFKVAVNQQELPALGKHGKNGYYWEKAGVVNLTKGQNVLQLKALNSFVRCDAIILSSEVGFDPNNQSLVALQQYRVAPLVMKTIAKNPEEKHSATITAASVPVAEIAGENIRLRFVKEPSDVSNKLVAKTDIKKNGIWVNMNPDAGDHKVYVITADDPQLSYGTFFPSWSNTKGSDSINVNGKPYKVVDADNLLNPFYSGIVDEAIPIQVNRLNPKSIEVEYRTNHGLKVKGVWSIETKSNHLSVKLNCIAPKGGYYSFAIAAFQSLQIERVTNVQMPPMFQYKRLSPQAKMLTSAMMPQPLAIVETNLPSGQFCLFVAPDVKALPANDWGTGKLAPYGFTLKNELNNVQPVIFSPVLGLSNSMFKAGETIERSFVIGAVPANWNNALEYISDQIYQVKDYRQQQISLTDAVFNMIDLIKNAESSGWDSTLKGFFDIEGNPKTAPTVVQSSPLTILSAAVITKDEDFYLTRALPTIEYTLSRSGFRWATDLVPTAFNTTRKTLMLNPFSSQFTTAYYEGLNSLLGEANPWISEIAMPGNEVRKTTGYSVEVPAWTQLLAAYRLTKDVKWLNLAKAGADVYITKQVYTNSFVPLSKGPFYNASFYANWWEFLDLYETTKDEKYLKAAEASAFHTIAGIRSYPLVQDTTQIIHPNNQFEGNTTMWWKGKKLYRLGYPRVAGDAPEKRVSQGLVSPVGLGFEQPETYFDPDKTVRPVYMSSWAPNLLRLYQYTHREIFNTYSRNAVIGRFGNYPGYYATGFTDITLSKDFPYKGPDVSSIYYHHIPSHLSFTMDYMITGAIERSNGKVSFPYGKQDAFVWFDNRVYGAGKGIVYDDQDVQLWIRKGLVEINSPEVNYVTGISKDRFWVLLSSESRKAMPLTLTISKDAGILPQAGASVYTNAGTKKSAIKMADHKINVMVSAKGFTAISFPLAQKSIKPEVEPVRDGMKILDLGEPWGKVFTYRIRSPFGWDSIYGFAETAPITDANVEISYKGKAITKTAYPFEWSIYKIDPKEKVELKIKFTSNGTVKEETITMKGVQ
jgi:hypothetical protein